jgi:hypothetical protein
MSVKCQQRTHALQQKPLKGLGVVHTLAANRRRRMLFPARARDAWFLDAMLSEIRFMTDLAEPKALERRYLKAVRHAGCSPEAVRLARCFFRGGRSARAISTAWRRTWRRSIRCAGTASYG